MPIKIVREDITRVLCDAIVNPTDSEYSGAGGVDCRVHEVAGVGLAKECSRLAPLEVGHAKLTKAYALPCKYVIHTFGPIWNGGGFGEEELLISCYNNCLSLAKSKKCDSIAIPLISSGTFGYPKDRVLKLALNVLGNFIIENEMMIYLVVYDKNSYELSKRLFTDITSFIDDNYVSNAGYSYEYKSSALQTERTRLKRERIDKDLSVGKEVTLDSMLDNMDKSFAETLFFYIDKKGISDVECYKRANVDKKTFSKIKCNKNYRPSKATAVSFAIALHLNLEETRHLLSTAGMCLSRSNIFDVIIEYFITTGDYETIYDVNETLYAFDQVTLGV